MACEHSGCYEIYGMVENDGANLQFRTIVRRRKQWFLEDQDAPGAHDEPVPPDKAGDSLHDAVLEMFTTDHGALLSRQECKEDGCECEYPEHPTLQKIADDQRQKFDGIKLTYVGREEVSSPDWGETPPRIFRAADGSQVTDYNPVVHTLELKSRQPLVYWLCVRYDAVVAFDITIDTWELDGTCKPNPFFIADLLPRGRDGRAKG